MGNGPSYDFDLFIVLHLGGNSRSWVSTSNNVFNLQDLSHSCTCATTVQPVPPPTHLEQDMNLLPDPPRDLPPLQILLALQIYLIICERATHQLQVLICNVMRQRLLIVLLLLLSGNLQPNPGPELQSIQTPSDLKSLSGLIIVHLNVHCLFPKMDTVRIWIKSDDIVVVSETYLIYY